MVSLDDVKLVKPENGQVFAQWEYKHLKKYDKLTGKFNLESGRASKTGPGTFIFATNEGRRIFNHIHGNIQMLGSKKELVESETVDVQLPHKPAQSSSAKSLPKNHTRHQLLLVKVQFLNMQLSISLRKRRREVH